MEAWSTPGWVGSRRQAGVLGQCPTAARLPRCSTFVSVHLSCTPNPAASTHSRSSGTRAGQLHSTRQRSSWPVKPWPRLIPVPATTMSVIAVLGYFLLGSVVNNSTRGPPAVPTNRAHALCEDFHASLGWGAGRRRRILRLTRRHGWAGWMIWPAGWVGRWRMSRGRPCAHIWRYGTPRRMSVLVRRIRVACASFRGTPTYPVR